MRSVCILTLPHLSGGLFFVYNYYIVDMRMLITLCNVALFTCESKQVRAIYLASVSIEEAREKLFEAGAISGSVRELPASVKGILSQYLYKKETRENLWEAGAISGSVRECERVVYLFIFRTDTHHCLLGQLYNLTVTIFHANLFLMFHIDIACVDTNAALLLLTDGTLYLHGSHGVCFITVCFSLMRK